LTKPSILLTGKIPSSVVATLESIGDLEHATRVVAEQRAAKTAIAR